MPDLGKKITPENSPGNLLKNLQQAALWSKSSTDYRVNVGGNGRSHSTGPGDDRKKAPESVKGGEPAEGDQGQTDPDSGYMVPDGKSEGFFCLDHDSPPYIDRLEHTVKKFGFEHTLERWTNT